MTLYRVVLLALFVVGGGLTAAAVPAGATTDAGVDATPDVATPGTADAAEPGVVLADVRQASTANNSTDNASLGADISSFMQSSTAEVGGAVETGMWNASFNSTENQSRRVQLVERRTDELRTELDDLRERKAELVAEREEGNVSETAYKAKVSRLLGQINALESAIGATTKRAEKVNADTQALGELRTETENLTGPEISAVARSVTGIEAGNGVGNGERGPPGGVGNGNDAAGASNGTTGPSNGVGNGTSDASTPGGPPSDVGDSQLADNGTDGTTGEIPNATTTTPPVTVDNPSPTAFSDVATTGLFGPVETALGTRTAAFARSPFAPR
ncbi:DUF7096 domain-containing protein [Halorussus salinisoli]|uniref:DUF7096 domain-containing protein n=1 Tax=Halorussus salinisoli TaxID=2558242 RepID=UPI0010C185BA|nr:hypothetical protein [Halorussus salinisoli]